MTTGLRSEDLGVDSCVDTVRIRVLPSVLQERTSSETPVRRSDPYPWTVDDMRRLSQAILRNRRSAK
jgi:hypothetical protein